jgi:hypothetical protein
MCSPGKRSGADKRRSKKLLLEVRDMIDEEVHGAGPGETQTLRDLFSKAGNSAGNTVCETSCCRRIARPAHHSGNG